MSIAAERLTLIVEPEPVERGEAGSETLEKLLGELISICCRFERIGEDILVLCTGTDDVVTSLFATDFLQPSQPFLTKFKEFCSDKRKRIETKEDGTGEFHESITADDILTFTEDGELKSDETNDLFDCYGSDTDELEDTELEEETRDNKQDTKVDNSTDLEFTPVKNKKLKPDKHESKSNDTEKILPVKQTKRKPTRKKNTEKAEKSIDNSDHEEETNNCLGNSKESVDTMKTDNDGNYLDIDEGLTIILPENSGIDFNKGEQASHHCFKCKQAFGMLGRLREHLTKMHKIKVGHVCICKRYFPDTASFEKHKFHPRYKVYHQECKECSEVCGSVNELKEHMKLCHPDKIEDPMNSGHFPCSKCGTLFHHSHHLTMHIENLPNCVEDLKDDKCNDKAMRHQTIIYSVNGKVIQTTYEKLVASQKKAPFLCLVCSTEFSRRSNFTRHLISHLSVGTHMCPICGKKFKGRDGVNRHIKEHDDKPYKCENCRWRFTSEEELHEHVRMRCKKGDKEAFRCDLCGHIASSVSALTNHTNMHAGVKPFTCDNCGKSFATKNSLDRHDIVMHKDDEPFQCQECGKRFKTKDNLKKHIKTHRGPQFFCNVCGKGCVEVGNLKKHMRSHTKEKPYVCELCGKAYGRKSLLDNHRRLHTGEKPYKCTKEGCGKAFRSMSNLKQHIRNHSSSHPYVCDVCGKMFKQPGRLNHHHKNHTIEFRWPCAYCEVKFKSLFSYKNHLAKHHSDMIEEIDERWNIKLHKCTLCSKTYGDRDDLQRHLLIHSGLKPFKCQYCNKGFNDKSNMRQHEKIHTGDKRYHCDTCSKAFIQRRDIRAHLKACHGYRDGRDSDSVRKKVKKNSKVASAPELLPPPSDHLTGESLDLVQMTNVMNPDYRTMESRQVAHSIIQLQTQPNEMTLHFLHAGDVPMQHFPVAAVNTLTGALQPLMIIENY